MKIALCFIINYKHILNKEEIWKKWIEPNKDIINIYFYYKNINEIKSKWILKHTLPENFIFSTTYTNIIPAYLSLMNYAINNDKNNIWFCFLSDACIPIISPKYFRYLFFKYHNKSLFSWKNAWWNPYFHKRSNLAKLPKELWLGNTPWFILNKKNVLEVIEFVNSKKELTKLITNGGIANESLFAIIFKLKSNFNNILNVNSTLMDWNRMSSATSPYLFKSRENNNNNENIDNIHLNNKDFPINLYNYYNNYKNDIDFINSTLEKNKFAIFLRKISPDYPDDILNYFIYEKNKNIDNNLIINNNLIYYFIIGLIILLCFPSCITLQTTNINCTWFIC